MRPPPEHRPAPQDPTPSGRSLGALEQERDRTLSGMLGAVLVMLAAFDLAMLALTVLTPGVCQGYRCDPRVTLLTMASIPVVALVGIVTSQSRRRSGHRGASAVAIALALVLLLGAIAVSN
ncbi:hypothetical protein EXU48_00560 [Occultella glacieicola]|uniref:Uncharacterized protein n=1 Tax=Occultella glacieicola TaxID=2518684 RepID=A0ABY2E9K1_9MICO|nr:hypothetical protein [Occultella glacieicola]TDE98739.1 hypothetical protein EXU48_00560 [Occultella glacieicola]